MAAQKEATRVRAATVIFGVFLAATAARAQETNARRLVEFAAVPMDETTTKLADALTAAFKSSDALQMSTGKKPGTLMISFPKPVEARAHMGRTEYLYRVEFHGVNGRLFERGFGSCWSDEIGTCVFNIVKLANRFAPR